MQNQQTGLPSKVLGRAWSNRILVLATAGILFLTLYPFRFNFHVVLPGNASPFLLGRILKGFGVKSVFLNILLFLPFGFGLSEKLRERGMSRSLTFALTLAAGALFSYGIELLQIYIPERDSGWEDVFTNTLGAVAGFVLSETLGKFVMHSLSSIESLVEVLLSRRRAFVVLLVYFGLWFASSSLLQRKTRLNNWRTDAQLVLGNDGSGKSTWKGTIEAVQVWDLALGSEAARRLSSGQVADAADPRMLVDYEFSAGIPFRDQKQNSSEFLWIPRAPANPDTGALVLDGASWLATKGAVSDLLVNLQRTNQFTVRVVCTPAEGAAMDGRIVSFSQASGFTDLAIRQDDANLYFWFRNPLSASHAILGWFFPGVFTPGRIRDIVYSYDGSNLSLFIDGIREPLTYRLGPGTALARFLRAVRPSELEGYNYIYYILVFFPAGAILGIAARNLIPLNFSAFSWLAVGIIIPAFLLEWILVLTSGRSPSIAYIGLSVLLAVGGSLWINIGRPARLPR
jgi:glycopeptide antibiotics resistance protein